MAEKKPEFTVTDRRLFTPEGEVRTDVPGEQGEIGTRGGSGVRRRPRLLTVLRHRARATDSV